MQQSKCQILQTGRILTFWKRFNSTIKMTKNQKLFSWQHCFWKNEILSKSLKIIAWMMCVVQYPIECFDKMPFETLDQWKKLRKKNFVKSTLIPCCRKFLVRMKNIWLKFTFYPPFSDVLKIFVNLSEIFTREKKIMSSLVVSHYQNTFSRFWYCFTNSCSEKKLCTKLKLYWLCNSLNFVE